MSGRQKGQTVEIASGETDSEVIRAGQAVPVGIYLPAAFTGTSISFTASDSGTGTFAPVIDSTGAVSIDVSAGDYVSLPPALLAGCHYIKIVSGSSEAAARSLEVVSRSID